MKYDKYDKNDKKDLINTNLKNLNYTPQYT